MAKKLKINMTGRGRDVGQPVTITLDLLHWSAVVSLVRQGRYEMQKDGGFDDKTVTGRWLNEDLEELCSRLDVMLHEHYVTPLSKALACAKWLGEA